MTRARTSFPTFLTVLGILALGGGVAAFMLLTSPSTTPEEKTEALKIVQTIPPHSRKESIHVAALGTVIPIREVTIKPEVRGRIVEHHPELLPGGRVREGESLVLIDQADYLLALNEHEAALEGAEFAVEMEQGRQVVAKREYGLLEKELQADDVNQSLVLRRPHLERAEAELARAKNEIAKAKLDLTRTTIAAPFNAVVIEEDVEMGQLVDSGAPMCKLAGTDAFWVRVNLHTKDLKWVTFPGPGREGSKATILHDQGDGTVTRWQGTVDRLLSDLDPDSRTMARLLVRVEDPLGHASSGNTTGFPLLLGMYVSVTLDAGTLENVLRIPRKALRNQAQLWLVDHANTLQIRSTKVLWTEEDSFLVENVAQENEAIIVSDLRAALPGMKVSPQPLQPDASQP